MLPSKTFLNGLAPDQQLEIFEMPGIRDPGEEVPTSIARIAAHYLAQLKAAYPEGPILLGGVCSGSLIAIEMAAQLADAGAAVITIEADGADDANCLAAAKVEATLLEPVVMIHRFYRLAEALARRLGRDPDRPRNLRKVTETV